MSNDTWMPEVGQGCEVFNRSLGMAAWERCEINFIGNHVAVYTSESCVERTVRLSDVEFRPIQTEAEKKRGEQIEKLDELIVKFDFPQPKTMAVRLYDIGRVRAIAPDEYVVKRLTDEQKANIGKKWDGRYRADIIHAVEKAIFGE